MNCSGESTQNTMVEQIMLHHYLVASLWYPLRFLDKPKSNTSYFRHFTVGLRCSDLPNDCQLEITTSPVWQKTFPRQRFGKGFGADTARCGSSCDEVDGHAARPVRDCMGTPAPRQSRRKGIATLREKDCFMLWKGLLYLGI